MPEAAVHDALAEVPEVHAACCTLGCLGDDADGLEEWIPSILDLALDQRFAASDVGRLENALDLNQAREPFADA